MKKKAIKKCKRITRHWVDTIGEETRHIGWNGSTWICRTQRRR